MKPPPRGTPHEVFSAAQDAVSRSDWAGLFACLDPADVLKIAGNSLRAALDDIGGLEAMLRSHGIQEEAAERLRDAAAAIQRSAEKIMSGAKGPEASKAHHGLVKALDAEVKQTLKSAADLSSLAGALEARMRSRHGGGSVSSRLFVGETLVDLELEEKRAFATRAEGGKPFEDVGFVKRKDGWSIRLFARRPAPRRGA